MDKEDIKRLASCIDVRIDLIVFSVMSNTLTYSKKKLSDDDVRVLVDNNTKDSEPYREIKEFLRELGK